MFYDNTIDMNKACTLNNDYDTHDMNKYQP